MQKNFITNKKGHVRKKKPIKLKNEFLGQYTSTRGAHIHAHSARLHNTLA